MALQQKLYELFLLDQQVRGLRTRMDAAASRRTAQQTKLDRLVQQLAELAQQQKEVEAKVAALEGQEQDMAEKIARFREQMNTVKNNKEYSALLIEVNTFKNEKDKVAEQGLEQMKKVEEIAKEAAGVEAKAAEQRKLLAGAEAEVAAAQAEVGQQLDAVTLKRDAAEKDLPAETRTQFNRVAHIHDGEAMAKVIEESRRHMEYTCGGCYMSIPVERVNALTRGRDDLVCCSNCGRILYLDEELKASMGMKT